MTRPSYDHLPSKDRFRLALFMLGIALRAWYYEKRKQPEKVRDLAMLYGQLEAVCSRTSEGNPDVS